jgi:hypothetical protein
LLISEKPSLAITEIVFSVFTPYHYKNRISDQWFHQIMVRFEMICPNPLTLISI